MKPKTFGIALAAFVLSSFLPFVHAQTTTIFSDNYNDNNTSTLSTSNLSGGQSGSDAPLGYTNLPASPYFSASGASSAIINGPSNGQLQLSSASSSGSSGAELYVSANGSSVFNFATPASSISVSFNLDSNTGGQWFGLFEGKAASNAWTTENNDIDLLVNPVGTYQVDYNGSSLQSATGTGQSGINSGDKLTLTMTSTNGSNLFSGSAVPATVSLTEFNPTTQVTTLLQSGLSLNFTSTFDSIELISYNDSATIDNLAVTAQSVPEPSAIVLFLSGLCSVIAVTWRGRILAKSC